jgi:hypothetical protein
LRFKDDLMDNPSTIEHEIVELDIAPILSPPDIDDEYDAFRQFLANEDDEPPLGPELAGLAGEGIAFSNLHCATVEEADAAHVAFLRAVWEIADGNL